MNDVVNNLESVLACGPRPNCVSSVAQKKSQYVAPISYQKPLTIAKRVVLAMIRKNPHAQLVSQSECYIHVVFTTRFFQFVDDVEFVFDEENKVIHFRSQSRVGYYDFGANRARMNALKKILEPRLND